MVDTQESLYEQLYSLSTIAKQRFVENFSGDSLDTDRWQTTNVSGTGTFAMADSADEGFSITTGGSSGNISNITFNNKRPFSKTGSVCIAIYRRVNTGLVRTGFASDTADANTSQAYSDNNAGNTHYKLFTAGGGFTSTATSINTDTNFHVHKIELTSSNAQLTIDGNLEVTKTTNLPPNDLQPKMNVYRNPSTGTHESRIKYMECYNT